MTSTIKSITKSSNNDGSYYGFIYATDNGKDFYFTKQDTNNLELENISKGINVEFDAVEENKKRMAINIKLKEVKTVKLIKYSDYQKNLLSQIELISNINAPDDFEDAIHLLIKLLGINKAFQFDRKNQAGKADGFFILENLAVMYDCTLNTNFNDFKNEQIENYVNKLSQKSQITFDIRKPDGGVASKTLQISGKKRQVWIITKGTTKEINDYEGIKVKEISVNDLCKIFTQRVKDGTYDIEKLSSSLILLGN